MKVVETRILLDEEVGEHAMLSTFHCFFDSLKTTGPFLLVQTGKREELEKRLRHGLHPDTKSDNGYTLLTIAIEYAQPSIITLLLRFGADPNCVMLFCGSRQFAIDRGFCTRKHGRALMRILLAYGATYRHIWDNVLRYYNHSESTAYQMVGWMDAEKMVCHRMYDLQKRAQRLFDMHEYREAQGIYAEAATMLEQLAAKDREDTRISNDQYKGCDAYYDDYCNRAAYCRTMARDCGQQLARQEMTPENHPLLFETKKTV